MSVNLFAQFDDTTLSDALKIEIREGKQKARLKDASDDFTDEAIGWQWTSGGTSPPTESGGVLNMDIANGSGYRSSRYSSSVSSVGGDFDIEVDFANWSEIGGDLSTAALDFLIDSNNFFTVRREVNAGVNRFTSYIKIGGSTQSDFFNSSVTSGKLKLIKKGDIVATYYDAGSGWIPLGLSYGFSTSGGLLSIKTEVTGTNTVSVDFDNFVVNEGGWFVTTAPTIETENVDFGKAVTLLVTDILIPSDTLAADTDIQIALSLDGEAFSSYYNLDSSHADKTYNIKTGQIGGDSIICSQLMLQIKLNSSGTIQQECGEPEIVEISVGVSKLAKFGLYGHRRVGA